MALDAKSSAHCSLRTRARTRLDFEEHGDVVVGSGGRGKISRHRGDLSEALPGGASPLGESSPCALFYIPENLEPWLRTRLVQLQAKNESSLAPVT